MATWATIETDATFAARLAAKLIRPAVFVYLNWPTGEVRATTHNKAITLNDVTISPSGSEVWSGVGQVAFIEAPEYKRNSSTATYRIGYTGLPQTSITEATEAAAIGHRAKIYIGLANPAWTDWALKRVFLGHIISAGDFRHHREEDGNWVTDASIEISNGRSPRRRLENHHSPETAEGSDTAWRLLPSVGEARAWPTRG